MSIDFDQLADRWRPDPETSEEVLDPAPARGLAAVLDQPGDGFVNGAPLPVAWTALYFLEHPQQSDLGADGHPRDGRFLPPVPRRRRMFGGGRVDVVAPLRFGDHVTRRSELLAARVTRGRTGELLIATVRRSYSVATEVRLVEEQHIIYRSGDRVPLVPREDAWPAQPAAPAARPGDVWALAVQPDPVMLFRFSALTHNAHRIHYDRPYAIGVERLPGILVHGPLLLVLALELPRRYAPDRATRRLTYRLQRPVPADQPLLAAATTGDAPGQHRLEIRTGGSDSALFAVVEGDGAGRGK
jgi:hydroxyacyl-ACP dehydratase HTD2-like protein with hotdog domain